LNRFLRGNKRKADFIAADLCRGAKQLVEPSLAQAALITGSDVTAVWWAFRREEYRDEICHGEMPLIPPRAKAPPMSAPKVNGATLPAVLATDIDDAVDAHRACCWSRSLAPGRVRDGARPPLSNINLYGVAGGANRRRRLPPKSEVVSNTCNVATAIRISAATR
jgi:hypothetical protein